MGRLQFEVIGTPAPQGSKRHVGNGVMVESSAKVKPWRQDVAAAARDAAESAGWTAPAGSVVVHLQFRLPRPRGHYGTGRNAGRLKPSAPTHFRKPDLDKLVRSTLDALTTARVLGDDAQVALLTARKVYADDAPVGASVTVAGGDL